MKQYENISAQLYANYLISIYKVIPVEYKSNNLIKLCREIREEFNSRVKVTEKCINYIH